MIVEVDAEGKGLSPTLLVKTTIHAMRKYPLDVENAVWLAPRSIVDKYHCDYGVTATFVNNPKSITDTLAGRRADIDHSLGNAIYLVSEDHSKTYAMLHNIGISAY